MSGKIWVGCIALLFVVTTLTATASEEEPHLLKTGDVVLTEADIRHYVAERMAAGVEGGTFASPSGLRQAVENLMTLRVLGQQARQQGVASDAQMEWELALYKDRLMFRRLVDRLVAEEIATVDWESLAREEYTANPDRFRSPEEVRVSHILVGVQERSEEEALELAQSLLARIQAGEPLAELAAEYSDDPSVVNNNGDMGFFTRGTMVRTFEEAAFALTEADELSGPVQTPFGYHVIQFHERRGAGVRPFEQVKAGIIRSNQEQLPRRIRDRLTQAARSPVDYEVDEKLFEQLLDYYRQKAVTAD